MLKPKILHHPYYKLSAGIVAGIIAFVVINRFNVDLMTTIMICWMLFCVIILSLSWHAFGKYNPQNIKQYTEFYEKSHPVVFAVLLFASLLSLFAVMFLLKFDDEWILPFSAVTVIYLTGVALSWFLQQTIFTFHYAFLYYTSQDLNKILDFPDTPEPGFSDFAYFSFTVGMTLQVSDVLARSGSIRKTILLHSLISFIFNIVILTLCINVILKI